MNRIRQTGMFNWTEFKIDREKEPVVNKQKWAALAVVVLMVGMLALLLLTSGCAGVDKQYATTTSGTHDIVFPDHKRYVAADPALTDDQKARRMRLLEAQEEADRAALGK